MLASEFFIKRPRFSAVIAIVMVLLGLGAIFVLPISQYPQITPPQIVISANYPGASASVIMETVAIPIENEINGVENMLYMSSTSNDNGSYQLTITFNIGTDPDIAQVKVENRLQQVEPTLPSIVRQEGLSVQTQMSNILGMLVLHSPKNSYDNLYLSNFAYTNLKNPLGRLSGLSDVTVYGPQYSMRVWLNPNKIASLKLSSSDIVSAIENQNTDASVGSLGTSPSPNSNRFVIYLSSKGLLKTVEDFENIVIKTDKKGGIIRLKDISSVEIGADSYQVQASFNNSPAVVIGLSQIPETNALDTMKLVKKEIKRLSKSFPADMELGVIYDSTTFVRASIESIISTLFITFLLVVGIVYLFLQNFRATLIPMITIPVSLISAFMIIYILGFDINILTLFALILAIGLVVDDAIIVVERVQYLMLYQKMDSVSASIQAMKDIGSAIIATTLVLLSIFIPVGLMAGITGKIYQQFAITIATAVVFSSVNALTLSPALCALFFKEKNIFQPKKDYFFWFNEALNYSKEKYLVVVGFLCRNLKKSLFILILSLFIIGYLFNRTPTSFIPQEDQGVVFANIQLPENASVNNTQAISDKLSQEILTQPGIEYFISIVGTSLLGSSGENIAMGVIGLKSWNERKTKSVSLDGIMGNLREKFSHNPYATIDFFSLPSIPGVGNSDGLSLQLNALNLNTSTEELYSVLQKFLNLINSNKDFFYGFSIFSPASPHIFLEIDRTKLEFYQIPISNLFSVLQTNLGSLYINNITLEGQTNKVIVQADFQYRQNISDVENLYIPNTEGKLIQAKEFIQTKTILEPKVVYRYNQYLSADITAQTATGVSTGTGISTLLDLSKSLGNSYEIAWTGLSLQEVETQGLALILIMIAALFGYLFLVALYESFLMAWSVILSNIFAIMGALIGLWIMGLPLSIYAQLGLILLIGLASKNAILIVEFNLEFRQQGQDIYTSALKGAGERFRAVLMTALTFILGVFPMVIATGAGASSQISIGTTVFFGMILATTIGILFVPVLFTIFDKLASKVPLFSKSFPPKSPLKAKNSSSRKKRSK